ncbi:hypothetical protein WJ96_28995 [Burkholderia ubonensis]|uniref:Uncharacterized protein n=1 Tax=Burkholderia ubonensis TaxID=101571 RepID=A0AAW3N4R4_9BURK|nr:hypothetical protein WJ96_28995 [Burkholderia ubonensis]KVZ90028.1 hypothetical protein WL25_01110 [Burkholderia ubonensis]
MIFLVDVIEFLKNHNRFFVVRKQCQSIDCIFNATLLFSRQYSAHFVEYDFLDKKCIAARPEVFEIQSIGSPCKIRQHVAVCAIPCPRIIESRQALIRHKLRQ